MQIIVIDEVQKSGITQRYSNHRAFHWFSNLNNLNHGQPTINESQCDKFYFSCSSHDDW